MATDKANAGVAFTAKQLHRLFNLAISIESAYELYARIGA